MAMLEGKQFAQNNEIGFSMINVKRMFVSVPLLSTQPFLLRNFVGVAFPKD